jgi:hypothetical protein
MSIEIERERKTEEDEVMSIGYLNLGMAYYDLCMFNSALFWSERMALQCQRKILPSDHPTLSVTYSTISSIYSTGLREMFCPGGIAPMVNDINIEFYTK